MADHLHRMASPPVSLSSSPGRSSAFSTRPHWPWSTYTHRNSANSSSSLHSGMSTSSTTMESRTAYSATGTPVSQSTPALWQPISNQTTGYMPPQEGTTRQWSFLGLEWVIRDVDRLRSFVEVTEPLEGEEEHVTTTHEDFEVLKESPILGDNKFKLEISHTPMQETAEPLSKQTLSVYITSLMLDSSHADYETTASIMVAIKSHDDRMGERGARAGQWVWEHWQNDWSFRQGSEVWEIPLPPMSTLLEDPKIRSTDAFILCIQVHCPTGPFIPQQPSSYYVPRELLDGLESLLDDRNTGDVQFVCLERLQDDTEELQTGVERDSVPHQRLSSSSSRPEKMARKRIIYAHSEILIKRSEYFATMFSSSFAETRSSLEDGKKRYTVIVEEADFETMYWLLKFCYANWLRFKDEDDPRNAIDGIGAGWSTRWLSPGTSEWAWKPMRDSSDDSNTADGRSATSGDTSLTDAGLSARSDTALSPDPNTTTARSHPAPPRLGQSPAKIGTPSRSLSGPSVARRTSSPGTSMTVATPTSPSDIRSKPIPISTKTGFVSSTHPKSPRGHRNNSMTAPDPHVHPTPEPQPASALAMYSIAHRYTMPNLAALSLEHIMATITPQSSFALLLASILWDELHSLVEDYVVDKWELVSASQDFEICCQEVAAGEWGPEGGQTFMKLLRRLRSPGNLAFIRA